MFEEEEEEKGKEQATITYSSLVKTDSQIGPFQWNLAWVSD